MQIKGVMLDPVRCGNECRKPMYRIRPTVFFGNEREFAEWVLSGGMEPSLIPRTETVYLLPESARCKEAEKLVNGTHPYTEHILEGRAAIVIGHGEMIVNGKWVEISEKERVSRFFMPGGLKEAQERLDDIVSNLD